MRQFAKPLLLLALMMLSVLVFSFLASGLRPLLGLTSELDYYIVNKWLFALLLLGVVLALGLRHESGLKACINWRTLPLYWPMALILLLISMGVETLPGASVAIKILIFSIAVGISEELMFRGLVFHWFRRFSLRYLVFISAASFGAMHLAGLGSEIHPAVIFAQSYFAFAMGIIFAAARARDCSILLPIAVHSLFDFIAISARGGVTQSFSDVDQMVSGMLVAGTLALIWGAILMWRMGSESFSQSQ